MNAYYSYLNSLISKNKITFAAHPDINWINPYSSIEYQVLRDKLLSNVGVETLFKGTKPYVHKISQGCRLCGEGLWSCLFIVGRCNANSFYCPAEQNSDDIPSSQGLNFPTAESYAEYISHFKFKGVGFSGGEPLLVKDKVLDYLREIRKQCDSDIYTWMYTNGMLASKDIFKTLAALNLNEVRFDIGATSYNLDKICMAKEIIENITIEIPAVPEEKDKIISLLPDMIKAGVTNLNLHQLRLTNYNALQLLKHKYTYIHAEKPVVLESELAALQILDYVRENHLDIGVNYCSFFFKSRFQAAGFRKRVAEAINTEKDVITEKGYLRNRLNDDLKYYTVQLRDEERGMGNYPLIKLKSKNYAYNKELLMQTKFFDGNNLILDNFLNNTQDTIPEDINMFDVWQHEHIENGIREY